MAQQQAPTADESDDLKSNNMVQPRPCKAMDIHNTLLFSWQKLFIDIRSEKEYKQSHIKQFINIPIDSNEQTVIETLKNALSTMAQYMHIDIYSYSNKNIMANKLDIKWNAYIYQILCKHFAAKQESEDTKDDDEDPEGYKFAAFNVLNMDYETFENKYKYLINSDNSGVSDAIKQYPSIIIEDKLFLGDFDDASNKKMMIDYGITHILNVTFECDNEFEHDKDLNITYLQFELMDSPNTNIADKFNECINFIENALNENNGNNNNRVMVHCFAGVSRSSSVVIAYFMKTKNMTFNDALEFVKHKRAVICPNEGFEKQLKMWQEKGYKAVEKYTD